MPLGAGHLPSNQKLTSIAAKYRKTTAQLILRWHLQLGEEIRNGSYFLVVLVERKTSFLFDAGTIPIPKSGTPSRIEENASIFNFEISSDDMREIEKMHEGKRYDWDPTNVE